MEIPLILTLKVSIMWNQFFWFNRIPQKQHVNEMEQEEQEDEYINKIDFLTNF